MYTLRGGNWKCPRVFEELWQLAIHKWVPWVRYWIRGNWLKPAQPGDSFPEFKHFFMINRGISWWQTQGDLIFKMQVLQQYWYGVNSHKLQNMMIETIVGKWYITIVKYKVVETNARKNKSDLQIRILLKFSLHTNLVLQMSKYFSITLYVSNLEFFAFFFQYLNNFSITYVCHI